MRMIVATVLVIIVGVTQASARCIARQGSMSAALGWCVTREQLDLENQEHKEALRKKGLEVIVRITTATPNLPPNMIIAEAMKDPAFIEAIAGDRDFLALVEELLGVPTAPQSNNDPAFQPEPNFDEAAPPPAQPKSLAPTVRRPPQLLPPATGNHSVNPPLADDGDQQVYRRSECIGPVIMGECKGTILPDSPYHPTCHGTMLNGICTGPMF